MTATILHFPTRYRIAWQFGEITGFVQLEEKKDWSTRDIKEAEFRMQQLKNRLGGDFIFWIEGE